MVKSVKPPVAKDPVLVAFFERVLAPDIAAYLNHLASQNPQPLTISLKIHPLNISEALAQEFTNQEKALAKQKEKSAAHECADPHGEIGLPRHQLCALISEMIAPLADATLAHHLWFVLTIGKDLPPPFAADRLGICASFDARRGKLRQRFAPERETAAPKTEPRIAAGMTLVCEPIETGYYRIPDDKRYRSASGLLMSDPIYAWTIRAIIVYHLALVYHDRLNVDERESLPRIAQQLRSLFRLLAIGHPDMKYMATLGGLSLLPQLGFTPSEIGEIEEDETPEPGQQPLAQGPKIVFGRYAGTSGSVQARNIEHQAAHLLTDRNRPQSHQRLAHAHPQGMELQPE